MLAKNACFCGMEESPVFCAKKLDSRSGAEKIVCSSKMALNVLLPPCKEMSYGLRRVLASITQIDLIFGCLAASQQRRLPRNTGTPERVRVGTE